MESNQKWVRILYLIGVIALIIGALDPMEGSVVIAFGSVLLALTTYLNHDRHQKIFLVVSILIVIGVSALFYLSSLGGFGGNSGLSWWWGMFILPYPIGWLIAIGTLIFRAVRKPKLVGG